MPNHTTHRRTHALSASFQSTAPHRVRGPARSRVREGLSKAVRGVNAGNPPSYRNARQPAFI